MATFRRIILLPKSLRRTWIALPKKGCGLRMLIPVPQYVHLPVMEWLPAGIAGHVAKNSPAYDAGIKAGDKIIEVNGDYFIVEGERCIDFESIFQAALLSSGEPVSYVVDRLYGTKEEIKLIPEKPAGSEKSLRLSGIDNF